MVIPLFYGNRNPMDDPTLGTPADSVTVQIVYAVADETGRDPNTLPPLHNVVNPDALNKLVNRPPSMTRKGTDVEVTFEIADCTVTVSSTGGVDVSAGAATPRNDPPKQTLND